jgi:hypothetical protein
LNAYRAYQLNREGKVHRPPYVLDVASDEAALEAARTYLDGHDIEVWQGQRFIATLRHQTDKP